MRSCSTFPGLLLCSAGSPQCFPVVTSTIRAVPSARIFTELFGRFSPCGILESVTEPSKRMGDQYGSVRMVPLNGKVVAGRIVNLAGDSFRVENDMLKPGRLTAIARNQIVEMVVSRVSIVPKGLLHTMHKDKLLDAIP